jgi:hypothetical protein
MYAWMWRHLPGPVGLRAILALALIAAAVVALFLWGFPAVAPLMPFNNGTVSP